MTIAACGPGRHGGRPGFASYGNAARRETEDNMTTFSVTTVDPQQAAVVRAEVPLEEIGAVFDHGFGEVVRVTREQGIAIAGPPFGFYPRAPSATVEVAVGFPVSAPVAPDADVVAFELPGGRVVTGIHVGPYERLEVSYGELAEWAATEGYSLAPHMWETYLTDPRAEPDPAAWQTRMVWPLA
jgi:effector-binding domain-containing protein